MPFLTLADDRMIFTRANSESCTIIKNILDKYCSMSGQLVNFHKSAFQCTANISAEECLVFQNILGMDNAFSLRSYLGCPIINSRVSKNTFGSVIEKSRGQLSKWKSNSLSLSLSQAGRAILIQSNL